MGEIYFLGSTAMTGQELDSRVEICEGLVFKKKWIEGYLSRGEHINSGITGREETVIRRQVGIIPCRVIEVVEAPNRSNGGD